jgi:hypothetical protein
MNEETHVTDNLDLMSRLLLAQTKLRLAVIQANPDLKNRETDLALAQEAEEMAAKLSG